ncbi:MAG: radical SAM/SPASM domain-containing protein [Myxococcales bacterium]|nr:radical SAM/SPASM domain-containing protein [Myxococcales bacterium]
MTLKPTTRTPTTHPAVPTAKVVETLGRVPPPWPTWINVENTLRCNLECIWCAQHLVGSTRSGVDMPLALFDRIVDQVLPRVSRLSFSVAGEPTIAPHFLDFLDRVNTLDITTELVTNATALHRPGLLDRLLPRLGLLIASLDGARPETVERIRAGARHARILENLQRFQRARLARPAGSRPEFMLAMTLSTANIDELPDLVDLASRLGADRVACCWLEVLDPSLLGLSLHAVPDRVEERLAAARAMAVRRGVGLDLPGEPPLSPRQDPGAAARRVLSSLRGGARRRSALRAALARAAVRAWELRSGLGARCSFLWGRAYLHAGGAVSPCCVQGRPYVGNLHERSFEAIWTGPEMTALRVGMFDGAPHAACTRCSQGQGPVPAPTDAWTAPARNPSDGQR